MLNKFGPSGHGEAQVQYLDGDFRVISPGTYVRCAVTDVRRRAEGAGISCGWARWPCPPYSLRFFLNFFSRA